MTATTSLQNSFSGGLKTEYTGLNFPENSCTAIDNCIISLIGEITRREGINFELNGILDSLNTTNTAVSYFRWSNAGGDGQSEILVLQTGATLHFFLTSAATTSSGISAHLLGSTVSLSDINGLQGTNVTNVECTYSTGNGYLFVYHPACDPIYCSYSSGAVTGNTISVQVRDFIGAYEPGFQGLNVTLRPSTLSSEHTYNLGNQGWSNAPAVNFSLSFVFPTGPTAPSAGNLVFTLTGVPTGLSLTVGEQLTWTGSAVDGGFAGTGTVSSYTGSTLVIASQSINGPGQGSIIFQISVSTINTSLISTWHSQVGGYPSNSDIWYQYKDTGTASGENGVPTFNPGTTLGQVVAGSANAPQGHYVLSAFDLNRSSASGSTGITEVLTTARPSNGCWFQGRVWYTGVNASQMASANTAFYTWTENIYFSQVVDTPSNFGMCYQENDPTNENLFDELATDGGVITIQGCGQIYKLFPIQNGIIVFASNGVWVIRGNSGLGFTANDYSINKISAVQSISRHSYIDIQGLPIFWNEEGIYLIETSKDQAPYGFGGLSVNPLTVGNILSFYDDIPLDSKRFARGDYDPLRYTVSWVYRSTEEAGVSNRYKFDSVLNLNTYNKAFYPYTISSNGACTVCGLTYMNYPFGAIDPQLKYLTSVNTQFTFSEENDSSTWFDWFSYDNTGVNYDSTFTTGYNLHGKGLLKWSNTYVYMYADNGVPYSYKIQGIWDYSNTGNSGRYSNIQLVTNFSPNYNKMYRRHKIRGHGMSLQFNIISVPGQPFTFFGWGMHDDVDSSL